MSMDIRMATMGGITGGQCGNGQVSFGLTSE